MCERNVLEILGKNMHDIRFEKNMSLQITILKKIVAVATADLDLHQSWLTCTMSPNVARFVKNAGIETQKLDVVFLDNERTRFLRQHWPKYFREVNAYELH